MRSVLCRSVLCFPIAILTSLPIGAQFGEKVEVWVANVDVVVTDRDGKPVRGLTQDDFEIYENGVRQSITNFSAIETAPRVPDASAAAVTPGVEPPPKTQSRLIVLFVDIGDIEPHQRQKFFEGVRDFLRAVFREGDLVTVLTWNHRVHVALPPTSDRRVLNAIIEDLGSPFGWNERQIMRRIEEMHVEQAARDDEIAQAIGVRTGTDAFAERAFQEWLSGEERCAAIKRKAGELRNMLVSLARVEMQKVMIFASDDVSLRPISTCTTRPEFEALAETANAYGMTIHSFHPPGARDNSNGPDRGGFLPGPNDPSPLGSQYARTFDESGGLDLLARQTGGLSGVGALQSAKLLAEAARELESYYSIGYHQAPGRDDKPRNIKVTTKNRAYRIRARQSVVHLSEPRRIRDLLTTSLYLPERTTPQSPDFDVRIGKVTRDGRFRRVEVEVSIRARDLTLLASTQGKLKGSFSVFVAAGRELGDASDVAEMKQDFETESKAEDDTRTTYSFTSRIRPDTRQLSIAVRDNVSGDLATKRVAHLFESLTD